MPLVYMGRMPVSIGISSATLFFCAFRATSHFFLDPPDVRFGFFQDSSNLLLTLRDGEQAGAKREAVFQPLDHCVYRSSQLSVQHHILDAPSVLKGRFDGCVRGAAYRQPPQAARKPP